MTKGDADALGGAPAERCADCELLRAQLAEAQQEFINLKKGEQAASDRAERALLGEATREDCEDTFALDVQELFKRAEAAEQQLAEAQLEQARQRVIGHGEGQLHAIADVNAGLIDDMIAPRLAAAEQQRDALLGRLAQIEQEMRRDDDGSQVTSSDTVLKWADTLRDLRVRSTPRTQETERCIKCGEPREAHTKSGADWRNTPGCVWLGRASEGASGDET